MTDKELLELAAKAAGDIIVLGYHHTNGLQIDTGALRWTQYWNPLTDDGDALRLAVKLGIDFHKEGDEDSECVWANNVMIWTENDPYAATRRAIVRAAAQCANQK